MTGIVSISEAEFEAMPPTFDGAWLRDQFPDVARVDGPVHRQGQGRDARRARRRPARSCGSRSTSTAPGTRRAGAGTSRASTTRWRQAPVFLLGDSAIGSPYFQSISLGLECAFFLAGHIANRSLSIEEMFERYEAFMYQQWLRVYMRTQMIKHNKDLLESVDDTLGLLAKLHVF